MTAPRDKGQEGQINSLPNGGNISPSDSLHLSRSIGDVIHHDGVTVHYSEVTIGNS